MGCIMKGNDHNNIKNLVDEGAKIKEQIDQLSKRLTQITKELKTQAKLQNTHIISGNHYEYVLTDKEFCKMDPETLYTLVNEQEFFKLVKVNISEARKRLGDQIIKNFGVLEKKKFYQGSFKPKQKTAG